MKNDFIHLCRLGNLEEAKQLLIENSDIDISARNDEAFCWACYNGHLEVAKWLLEVKPDINISNECTFRTACSKGHLEVAKWLLEKKSDINAKYAFIYFEVAKWLLGKKPDINISANNDEAFIFSCIYGYLEVVKWLQTLNPDIYYVEIANNKIVDYRLKKKK